MKYELQFTVKPDAVKQNRKLPEIAFFDTDGNPISLGGVGGSVDVSDLLPLDGSRAMTGPLEFGDGVAEPDWIIERQNVWDDPNYLPLVINNPNGVEVDFVGTGGVSFSHIDDPSDLNNGYPAGAFIWQGTISTYAAGLGAPSAALGDGTLFLSSPEEAIATGERVIKAQAPGDMALRWGIDVNGKIEWGDGVNPLDVSLERDDTGVFQSVGVGDLRIPGHHALLIGDLDPDYTLAGASYGDNGAYWQFADGDSYAGISAVGAVDLQSLPSSINLRFDGTEERNPALHMSSNKGYMFFGLDQSGFILNDDVIDVGWNFQRRSDAGFRFNLRGDGLMRWGDGSGANTMTISRYTTGLLEIHEPNGGIVAHSIDGTPYKLIPPNGGGAATWVAA